MEGMHDIIPPAPVPGAFEAALGPAASHPALAIALLLLTALAALWLGRHRLIAGIRRTRAMRALREGGIKTVERLLEQHHRLPRLHPGHPPRGIGASAWRALIEGLHEARFSPRPCDLAALVRMTRNAFPSRPIKGEGAKTRKPSPPSSASRPIKGEDTKAPPAQAQARPDELPPLPSRERDRGEGEHPGYDNEPRP